MHWCLGEIDADVLGVGERVTLNSSDGRFRSAHPSKLPPSEALR